MGKRTDASNQGVSSEKMKLTSLVSYQPGSVVSRTLINERQVTVTLFAFDEGSGLSEHTTPYQALLHVIEGEAEVTIGGKHNRLGEGEMIMLPPRIPHEVRAPKRFKMILTMARSK